MFHCRPVLPVWSALVDSHQEEVANNWNILKPVLLPLGFWNIPKLCVEIVKVSVTTHLFRGLQNRGRLDQNAKDKLDLTRLRARRGEKPRTKAGQVRQAWPDIKALFEAGHSLKDIWAWLKEIGIEIGYARLHAPMIMKSTSRR
jgi:hypothetical protein